MYGFLFANKRFLIWYEVDVFDWKKTTDDHYPKVRMCLKNFLNTFLALMYASKYS